VTFNLREVVRGELFAAPPDRKRILAQWLRRADEGEAVPRRRLSRNREGRHLS
jgi:hypothetical protein